MHIGSDPGFNGVCVRAYKTDTADIRITVDARGPEARIRGSATVYCAPEDVGQMAKTLFAAFAHSGETKRD